YSNIPLKQNYRTNILGALLTKETEIKVEILPGFGTPDEVVDIWDGKTTSIPSYDEVTKTFTINNGAELAWVAGVVNGTIPATRSEDFNSSFNGLTIRLAKSIDLGGSEWTPIGVGGKRFSGTIDGNNKTISNFQITKCHGDKPQAALFGNLALTTLFKDLTIANATVIYPRNGKDFYGAALIGTAYGSVTCQNVTVKDSYISGNNKVGAILAHDGRTSNVKIDNCHVLNSTIESLDSADGGCVGGLIGYFAGIGGGEFKISNSTVKQSTINGINSTNSGKRANSQFIGCINSDANQQLYINNCSVEDNIFTDVDNNGNAVTYKSIYGKFIGGERYDAPKGKVYIDNVEVIANGIAIDNEGNYCITAVEGFAWIEAQTDNFFSGKTIKLVANMNLEGIDYKPIRFWDPENPIIFDGQNYTISNLTINNGSSDNQALFNGTLSVKNLKVDNATVTGRGYTAAICGSLYGNIDNCHITNSTITGNYWQVGGFVGQHDSGMITNSSISKSTINGPSAVGALTGITNESTKNRKFENCSVTECAIVANYSFGGSYDFMYGVAVGLINIENSEVYFNNCTIDNNTIKGVASDELYGVCEEGTVVYINNTISVSNNEQLKAAAATQSTIMLANGNDYDLNGIQKDGLKLIGIGNNVRIANTTQYASGKSTGAIWKAINLENMTITNTVYTMADGSNASFTKVTFEAGFRQGYGKNVIFTNCSFGSNSEGYALHFQTDSASDGGEIKLTGCQFNGGKVHLGGKRAYTFSGCEFAENTDFQVWSNITLENCTVDGVAVTSSNIATLFPNLNLEKVTLK
ncbi:MAG: hypothetical protein IIW52_03145, partial [Alistipes sp.]|nr:hypothetical protein [Alistipes sp.]